VIVPLHHPGRCPDQDLEPGKLLVRTEGMMIRFPPIGTTDRCGKARDSNPHAPEGAHSLGQARPGQPYPGYPFRQNQVDSPGIEPGPPSLTRGGVPSHEHPAEPPNDSRRGRGEASRPGGSSNPPFPLCGRRLSSPLDHGTFPGKTKPNESSRVESSSTGLGSRNPQTPRLSAWPAMPVRVPCRRVHSGRTWT